jgi:uncharacterized phage-like protein YoqJ
MKIAVTGHRPQGLPGGWNNWEENRVKLEDAALETFRDLEGSSWWDSDAGEAVLIHGGAIGVDLTVARVAHNLGWFTHMYIPCAGQDRKWGVHWREKYEEARAFADMVVQVSDKPYYHACMQERNVAMINDCHMLVAFWAGQEAGGTWNAMQSAQSMGKTVEIVRPWN